MYRELEQPFVFILSEKWIYDADTECLRRYLSDRLSGEWYQCISCANTPHLLENEINDLKHAVLLWKSSLRWACFLFWCVCVCVCRCFDGAVEEWRQFHCDMNDLSQWLSDAEKVLADGELHLDRAHAQQQVRPRVKGHRSILLWPAP